MKRLIIVFCVFAFSHLLKGQDKFEALEAKKREKLTAIQFTRDVLSTLSNAQLESISAMETLSAQITLYEELLVTLAQEQEYLSQAARGASLAAQALEEDLVELKKEYGEIIYQLSKTVGSTHPLYFLLASESFSQLAARTSYIRHYQLARKRQIMHIEATKKALSERKLQLDEAQMQTYTTAQESKAYLQVLDSLKAVQQQKIIDYAEKTASAEADLRKLKQGLAAINRAINQALKESMARQTAGTSLLPDLAVDKRFYLQKGKLPWPVKKGFVSAKFGKHPHQAMAGVMVENLGIDITTEPEAAVITVYQGIVTAVTQVPGMHIMVMLQHQDYFTVYAKLKNVEVQVGDVIETGQVLGYVANNSDGLPQLQFQLWKNHNKQDPEEWLNINQEIGQ